MSTGVNENSIRFPSLPAAAIPRSCSLDAALYTLQLILEWQADVEVAGQLYSHVSVFALLRRVWHDPAAYGVTAAEAQAAADRFIEQVSPVLESQGGRQEWLEREWAKD